MVTVRPITENDFDACTIVFMEAYNRQPWNCRWTYEKAIKYLKEYAGRDNFTGFVLCVDDKVTGAAFAHTKTWWTNDQFYIDELFIDPDKQGSGYGTQLINHCNDHCKQQGIEMITLMTNKLVPAFDFYIRNDYSKVDQYVFMFHHVE